MHTSNNNIKYRNNKYKTYYYGSEHCIKSEYSNVSVFMRVMDIISRLKLKICLNLLRYKNRELKSH